jgi:hypothetical protein
LLFSIVVRALKAPGSRNAVFRLRHMPHDHGVVAAGVCRGKTDGANGAYGAYGAYGWEFLRRLGDWE